MALAAAAGSPARPPPDADLTALAPYLSQLVRLAAVDPNLAATLVPDVWIDSLTDAALAVEAETVETASSRVAAPRWPIGPWASPASMVKTIEGVDPRAVAALYRAIAPRVSQRCRARGASLAICERAMRSAGSRLCARSVLDRANGRSSEAITPTQRQLAGLGPAVVSALRGRIHSVGSGLWGPAWRD